MDQEASVPMDQSVCGSHENMNPGGPGSPEPSRISARQVSHPRCQDVTQLRMGTQVTSRVTQDWDRQDQRGRSDYVFILCANPMVTARARA